MHRFFFSLRFRLILLVLLALIPALALTIYTGLEGRRIAIAEAEQTLQKITRLIAIEYDQILERSEQLLIILAQLQLIQDFDQKKCQALFLHLLKKFRGFDCIGIISTGGNVICHTPQSKQPISFAGQSWFERTIQTRGFANGHYQICPITNRSYLPLAYPVLDEKREVKGVISVGLDLLWLNQLASEVQLPKGAILFVIDPNGTILAHYPDPQKWVGRSVQQAPIVKTMLTLQKEDTREALGIDGVMHVHSSTPVGRKYKAGLYVGIGIPKKVVFSKVDLIFSRNLILLGIVTALASVAAWFFGDSIILRKVNVLLATTDRLARGDPGARTELPLGKGESDQLANSFDRMAETLEQYDANRKERGEEERRLREFAEIVFNSMRESISVIDVKDFRVIDANYAYLNDLGLKKEEVIGKHCYELTHCAHIPCTPPDHPCPILDLIKNGKYSTYEHIHYRKNEKRYVEVSAMPITDKGGKIVQVVHVARDITERKLLEEQFLQSQKMETIGMLAGGIAHDFNNLLMVIQGNVELGLMNLEPSHSSYESLLKVEEGAQKASDLTRQLLAFGRRQMLNPKVLNVADMIGNLSRMLSRLIGEDIELRMELRPGLSPIYADPSAMDQVLMNLIVNARDAMPQGGFLTLQAQDIQLDEGFCRQHPFVTPGEYVQISVIDTGKGMDEKTLSRIFEPFFTTREKGSGLGLAVVYGIVKQHKGHIFVSSRSGEGSRFDLYFPVHRNSFDQEAIEAISEEIPRGTEAILIAEDEQAVRELFKTFLKGLGYRAFAASDGEEAIEVFLTHRDEIKLVILDAVMPKLSGPQVYERIRLVSPDLPCLLSSGYTDEIVQRYFSQRLKVPTLHKPVTLRDLGKKVREILDQAKKNSQKD